MIRPATNRNDWLYGFTDGRFPAWPCPACRRHRLTLFPDSLKVHQTAESKANQKQDWSGPDDIAGAFVAWAHCPDPACDQQVAIAGRSEVVTRYRDHHEIEGYYEVLHPLMVWPPPPIITIPSKCPAVIRVPLESAFPLFWADHNACASRVRGAVEAWLSYLKIAGADARGFVSLHRRLQTLKVTQPELAELFQPLKLMGNDGAHEDGDVSDTDLLDAFEVIEHVLHKEFGAYDEDAKALAQRLERRFKK